GGVDVGRSRQAGEFLLLPRFSRYLSRRQPAFSRALRARRRREGRRGGGGAAGRLCCSAGRPAALAVVPPPRTMPRVVPDSRKCRDEDSFRKLSRECEIKYTGFRDRPHEERQARFQNACRDGRSEIVYF
uniref:Core-binding factor subunit beta n=1 Tax=Laticauda laticaudata TaxID=8630 RepID=A0A8C5SDQ4_LATLA